MKYVPVATFLALAALSGCANKLETGYQPRTIGSNETERRGYYAAPFTKEAREAQEKATNNDMAPAPLARGRGIERVVYDGRINRGREGASYLPQIADDARRGPGGMRQNLGFAEGTALSFPRGACPAHRSDLFIARAQPLLERVDLPGLLHLVKSEWTREQIEQLLQSSTRTRRRSRCSRSAWSAKGAASRNSSGTCRIGTRSCTR
jgi:hypothetical protein